MKIKYALHGVDSNPLYSDFWEPVSKIWKIKFDVVPVLLAVMEEEEFKSKKFDETYGKAINIKPIKGVPLHLQAQWIRYWYTINFPNEVSIVSDIDMFPLSKQYFVDQIEKIEDNKYVHLYSNMLPHLPACYHVAKGETFKKILRLPDSFEESMREMMRYNTDGCITHMGMQLWNLEEKFSSNRINLYPIKHDLVLLNRNGYRIDRDCWHYDEKLLKQDFYIDCHSLRPYKDHKHEIDKLVRSILE